VECIIEAENRVLDFACQFYIIGNKRGGKREREREREREKGERKEKVRGIK